MRITTNQIINNYQTGLNNSASTMYKDMITVMSGRAFQVASEDPSSAAKAFNLRREYLATEDHLKNTEDIASRLEASYDSALQISTVANQVTGEMIKALNGATGYEARVAYAESMDSMKETIVASCNVKFGDTFIFGGENIANAPFQLNDYGRLEYTKDGENYVAVSGDPPSLQETVDGTYREGMTSNSIQYVYDSNGNPVIDPSTGEPLTEPNEALQEKYDLLESYANDSIYVDLGFGLDYNSSGLVENSAFDLTTSGLNMLGYGDTAEGLPANVVDVMAEFADELRKEEPNMEYLRDLYEQFTESASDLKDFTTTISTKASYVEDTNTRLTDALAILSEKIVATEQVDLAEAITNYSWSTYAYNQALKIGNNILSQSFIDFM